MSDPGPTRSGSDLADVVEMLLDKGVVVNADIAVSVGDTELLGVQVRAAIASFETAAEYGLEFPEGTDTDRVEAAARGRSTRGLDAAGDTTPGLVEGPAATEAPEGGEPRTASGDGDEKRARDDGSTRERGPDHPGFRPRATPGSTADDQD